MLGVAREVMGSCNDECCDFQNKHSSAVSTLPKSNIAVDNGVIYMLCTCSIACVEEGQSDWAVR